MIEYKVLVTCPPMLKLIDRFRQEFNQRGISLVTPSIVQVIPEEELINLVPEVDGWIIGDDPATRRVFSLGKAGKLKAAVKWGVGTDNVDIRACKELKILFANTPNMFGAEVADLAINYLLGLARHSYYIHEEIKKGNWVKPTGISISGKTIAVIGLGDIGCALIKRLQGFDVNIIGYDPKITLTADKLKIDNIFKFPHKIESADFIILTTALTLSNKHMINDKSIKLMKDGVRIINVARGGLINEKDLIIALKEGKVSAVALDVFENEPISLNHPLLHFSQCIFGSHNASNTFEAVERASKQSMELMFNFLNLAK